MIAAKIVFGSLGVLFVLACSRAEHKHAERARPPAPAVRSSSELLPDIPSFSGGPVVSEPQFARRTYLRASASVTVTIGTFVLDQRQYDDWVSQSETYPQAKLDLPPSSANGFYECDDDSGRECNLLIQLRAGRHIEIRRGGTASRVDVDDVAAVEGLQSSPREARATMCDPTRRALAMIVSVNGAPPDEGNPLASAT